MGVQFIKDIAKMDVLTTRNCPSFHLTKVKNIILRDKF
jgi:hypothetical protein